MRKLMALRCQTACAGTSTSTTNRYRHLRTTVRQAEISEDTKPLSRPRGFPVSTLETSKLLSPSDTFLNRHLGPSDSEVSEMLSYLELSDLEDLISQTVPANIRRKDSIEMHEKTMSESQALEWIEELMKKNENLKNFIGMGYHGNITPTIIQRCVLENPEWYTAYTPYQAEISQGRLESLVNFQTMVANLTGMDVANAGLLDEGTAAAEAVAMVARSVSAKEKKKFFISDKVHPQTIDVVKTRANYQGIQIICGDLDTFDFSKKDLLGAMVQYPDTTGRLRDYRPMAETFHDNGAMLVSLNCSRRNCNTLAYKC